MKSEQQQTMSARAEIKELAIAKASSLTKEQLLELVGLLTADEFMEEQSRSKTWTKEKQLRMLSDNIDAVKFIVNEILR